MITKTKSTVCKEAYGNKLEVPVPYTYSWKVYETEQEMVAANDQLSLKQQVKARAREAQSNERSKALKLALTAAGIEEPTIQNDEQLRLTEMFKVLMSSKRYTEEQARELASSTLGIEWADDDDK